jgi:hypothetical protein
VLKPFNAPAFESISRKLPNRDAVASAPRLFCAQFQDALNEERSDLMIAAQSD